MLSGFTLVRNAIKLDFPIIPAIRSVLAVRDEVVVNVGASEDGTRDLSPRSAIRASGSSIGCGLHQGT
jgi:hypothetical protein